MTSEGGLRPNRLVSEKSPYLLQHAYNPVDWYPWGAEAFGRAQAEDKPVFLSIGYSTCHWCHVMEKESFEDLEVAKMLNEAFVCVKVDREERPDLDATFMKVCQALSGTGGWPLHIIMTADKKPFFAATYIPKEARFGKTGLKQIILQIKQLWTSKRSDLVEPAEKIAALLREGEKGSGVAEHFEELGEFTLDEAYVKLEESFDEDNGGFGCAPKFPSPHTLSFLLRYWKRTRNGKALEMVEKTLRAMRLGGVYDQLGSGFHRYSTDSVWLVPHFEKMLYDQAMLVIAYAEAFQATRKDEYRQTAQQVIAYVLRDMTDEGGGFYSAEDADSEGEEGKYYLWTMQEVREALSPDEADLVKNVFSVDEGGNFTDPATGEKNGKNILHQSKPLAEMASSLHMCLEDAQRLVYEACQKLLRVRQRRVHPSRDDKILTDWNGLMIAALAKAGQIFGEPRFAAAARKAADFIMARLRDGEGRLVHRYRKGEADIAGFLDDYAFLIWGLVELYEATFGAKYLMHAVDLADKMLLHFWDKTHGGFYQTADYSETVLVRNKQVYDGAYPSGNSVAALDLIRLARITGETRFEEKTQQLMRAFSVNVARTPHSHTQLMIALDFALGPSSEIVIVGDPRKKDTAKMLQVVRSRFLPRTVVLFRSSAEESSETTELAKFTRDMKGEEGKATAFVCRDYVCKAPTTDPYAILELLDA
jgi:uncharacterized protein YyaL (SSP411 family)